MVPILAPASRVVATFGPLLSRLRSVDPVITCVVDYVIDPAKLDDFERFAHRWMDLVEQHGGTHHGYFLPSEGASDRALALFSFPSFAAYEQYRSLFGNDPDFVEADRIRDETGCVLRYDRTFMRPLLPSRAR
jgi:hypothetical protein